MATLVDNYRALAQYNTWMNQKLLAVATELSAEEWSRDLGAFFRSVQGTFNHLLLGDLFWLSRLTGDRSLLDIRDPAGDPRPFTGLDMLLHEELGSFASARAAIDERIEAYVGQLDEGALARTLRYRNSAGNDFEQPVWWALTHLFNHQTHHRGQLTTLLMQLGRDPGVTDLVMMLRAQA